ncbi:GtrA family protein [Aliiroseovarius sp. M344]|uniref:GtrA family protein n=1 Tax=Aliiroseovarius sp. M344 TaxID=2867010 RepID=UPI00220BCCE0|nr:GtrA family protein [Aliiroseovarius sp. M344]UWQ13862.1 GtrA family protein [Aliiroseovarius sp. M344]
MLAQLFRFIGVGGLATITHVLLATIAHKFFVTPEMWSNFIGFCGSVLISYSGHSSFTFAAEANHKQHFPKFLFVSLTGLAASSSIVWVVSTLAGGSFYLAMGLVALIVPLATFLALRFWVFSHGDKPLLPSWPMVVIATGAIVLFMWVFWNWPVNHDTAWYLVATRKMLDGAKLYVDIIEVNPPLTFYLTIPAIWIADFLSISDSNGQYIFFTLLYYTSLLWSGAILRSTTDLSPFRRNVFFFAMAVVYLLAAADQTVQREHLLVLFLSPWLIWNLSPSARSPSLTSSVFAAIGICIKPFFLVFPVAFLLRDMWRNRSLKPILYARYMVMLAVGVCYLAFVALRHPEYLNEIIPIASLVYGAYKNTVILSLTGSIQPLALGLIILLPVVRSRTDGGMTFALAALAALASFVVQSTGFSYQLIPFVTYSLLAGAWFLVNSTPVSLGAVLSSLASALLLMGLYDRGKYTSTITEEVIQVAQEVGPISSIMTGSFQLDPGAPVALRLGVDWVSRYPANWLYPGAVQQLEATDCNAQIDLCAQLQAIADRNRNDNFEDIIRYMPDLIVSDRAVMPPSDNPFTWMTFMKGDPRFDELMKNYTLVHKTERMDYYLLNRG